MTDLVFGRDELAHYYYAQAEHQLNGNDWRMYRTAIADRVRSAQEADGGWPAGKGTCVGRVYAAAVWCTVLQLDRDRHPAMRRREMITR